MHQFRLLKQGSGYPEVDKNNKLIVAIRNHVPKLHTLTMGIGAGNTIRNYMLYLHEFGHLLEMVDREQPERLKIENFGWPVNKVGWFNPVAAEAECRTVAYSFLIAEYLFGDAKELDFLGVDMMSSLIGSKAHWTEPGKHAAWMAECKPADRINQHIEEYRPKFKELLDKTVDVIVDECAELV